MADRNVVITCKQICKNFGVTKALVDVDLTVYQGEIHGLVGENGSGKSTLSSIFAGVYFQNSGEMFLKGKPYSPKNIVDAENNGIAMITQEQGTINGVSIAGNLFLGKEKQFSKAGFINTKAMNAKASVALKSVGMENLDPSNGIETLSFEDRKLVEIARALESDPDLLIIDETTTALSANGRIVIKEIIGRMKQAGKAVLFISHDIDELLENCDSITVLRDGKKVDTCAVSDLTVSKLQKMMVGRDFSDDYFRSDYEEYAPGDVAIEVRNLSSGDQLENVSFDLHYGEILGISGLSNSGIHELGKTLFGLIKPLTGSIILKQSGKHIRNSQQAIKNKIAYIPKNRDTEALFIKAPIDENIAVTAYSLLEKVGYISKRKQIAYANKVIEEMMVKCQNCTQSVNELSGGNKQKVVFGKWTGNESSIFILDCPTRGIDIGVKSAMYHLIDQMRKDGKAILLISEELPELIGMSDRLLTMKDGIIQKEFARSKELTETDIIQYII